MAEPVKRQYRSALRTAQARETRRAIVSAAGQLFVRDGFGATTIDAVAEEAGVSRKTVFTSVGGKVELLKLSMEWAIAGDDQPVAVDERPEIRRLLREDDPVAMLRGWARTLVTIDARVAGLFRALELAADVDPDARSLYDRFAKQRLAGARFFVNRLVAVHALRDDLTADEATDLAWLAGDPALYDRLIRQRGWSMDRVGEWLGQYLVRSLLDHQER
jgi:AcrR family transcriptional regulator